VVAAYSAFVASKFNSFSEQIESTFDDTIEELDYTGNTADSFAAIMIAFGFLDLFFLVGRVGLYVFLQVFCLGCPCYEAEAETLDAESNKLNDPFADRVISYDYEEYITTTLKLNERGTYKDQLEHQKQITELRSDTDFQLMRKNSGITSQSMRQSFRHGGQGALRQSIRFNVVRSLRMKTNMNCTICADEFTDGAFISTLECNKEHFFHKVCLAGWISKKQALKETPSCPMCRVDIDNEKTVHGKYQITGAPMLKMDDDNISDMFGEQQVNGAMTKAEKNKKI